MALPDHPGSTKPEEPATEDSEGEGLLAVTFCCPPPATTVATAGIPIPLGAEQDRGPERWDGLPESHSVKWAELGQGCQTDGAGEGLVMGEGEAGFFSNKPSKLPGLRA